MIIKEQNKFVLSLYNSLIHLKNRNITSIFFKFARQSSMQVHITLPVVSEELIFLTKKKNLNSESLKQ